MTNEPEKELYCSWCAKAKSEVKKLIAGPSVFICDVCVELCVDIVREERNPDFCKGSNGFVALGTPDDTATLIVCHHGQYWILHDGEWAKLEQVGGGALGDHS